jgi:hypothetical protein
MPPVLSRSSTTQPAPAIQLMVIKRSITAITTTTPATGFWALFSNTTGVYNTATGNFALYRNTTGTNNTAIGLNALTSVTTGNYNIGLGRDAGSNLTTGDNNIDIGSNFGVIGESNTIRIGVPGTQTKTFIAGIREVTVTGGLPVAIDANGQLGTGAAVVLSSPREKGPSGLKRALAEYQADNAKLKHELAKQRDKVQELATTVAEQRKGLEGLAARLKEQAAQIQKVSDQLELNKPAPRTVGNNQ